jgi:nucleoside-diphosphate-sugar epimerase
MKILITGGAGYLGATVLETFLRDYPDASILVIDNLSKGRIENIGFLKETVRHFDFAEVDLRDYEKIEKVVAQFAPDSVIHLGAIVDAFATNRKGKDEECMDVNYSAAVALAKICKAHAVKDFIFQCTVSLYSAGEAIREDGLKNPISTYGKAKLLAETEILALADATFRVCSLRPATIVGYNTAFRYETIINKACMNALYDMPVTFFQSALLGNKSYLTLKDNTRAIEFTLLHMESMNGQSYNISSFDVNLTTVISCIQTAMQTVLKKEYNTYVAAEEKTINQQVYTVSAEKIRAIGFVPEGEIQTTITNTIASLFAEKNAIEQLTRA